MERIAVMMNADELDAAPLLELNVLTASSISSISKADESQR
jgi:hypothetical protein